jgi:glycosidase
LWRFQDGREQIIKFFAAVRYLAVSAGRWPRMTDKATSDLWWKDGVIYCADVATWVDSDGDGVGDLAGLTQWLDYLSGLGVTTLWMMPFYPSPLGDDEDRLAVPDALVHRQDHNGHPSGRAGGR